MTRMNSVINSQRDVHHGEYLETQVERQTDEYTHMMDLRTD